MKLITLIILLPYAVYANSLEVNASFLTTHLIGNQKSIASLYKNKINDRGVLKNKAVGISLTKDDNQYSIFAGDNSVGEPIIGFKYARVHNISTYIELNWTLGAYYQNGSAFPAATKTCDIDGCRSLAKVSNIMPIVGLDLNFYLYRGKLLFIKQYNLITPIITNHGLSIGKFYD